MEFKYSVILACLALMIFLIVKEIRRTDKSRLIGRLLASLVMVVCFAFLIIPITYVLKKEEPAGQLNLLTEGTSIDTILAIKGAKYDIDSTLFPKRNNLKINHLADLNYHLKIHPEIKRIHIYGYGLSDWELKTLKNYQISFHPSAIPSGVISASWPKKLKATEQLTVQGVYHNSTNKTIKLKLFGLGTSLDSLVVKANNKANFSFNSLPKQIGRAVFNIVALQGKDTLSAESIPFEVANKQPINVLILASFPDFEYKFLKKWLFENKFQVAFRSQISKNKYNTEFLNRNAVNLNQINQNLLKDIDLVISDENELSATIYTAVNNGMGLIVRASKLPATKNHQPLLRDEKGKITVDSRLSGMGKIVTTTLVSTFQWQLAGKQKEYSKFWSLLFSKSLRKEIKNYTYNIEPQWPTVNEKAKLIISSSTTKPPLISIDSLNIAPRQNMELPFVWDGFFWPKTAGWTVLSIDKKAENSYIYEKTDWKAAKNYEKLKSTLDFASNLGSKDLKEDKIEYLTIEELSKWWFFMGFLVAISFLWYEQRFLANK